MMKLEYDKEVDAAYIYLEDTIKDIKETVELNKNILLDLDSNKKIVGIEILDASKVIKKEVLLNTV